MTPLQRIITPSPARPLLLDLALAATLFCIWLALQGFDPLVAYSPEKLHLEIILSPWYPQWHPGPWTIGFITLGLAWARQRFLSGAPELQQRLQRATLLIAALLAFRIIALWTPFLHLFPFLTLLWAPHALWAIGLAFFGYIHWPSATRASSTRSNVYLAGGLLAICLPVYSFYTLYFCQVTMLHGDEGQYLHVTQSLLHDGDMDLANNIANKQSLEFHVLETGLHKAPASPEGKVHSVHPIGLSVALLPAYEWGLSQWENPRLASALFMALLASLCIPLIFLWLTRLGAERWASLLAVTIMTITGPFFYYSNQLYPEVPALLIALMSLLALAHWQIPGGSYRSWGQWEIPALAVLTLLLCCLPFLHARYTPIGLLCGIGVILQGWYNPHRPLALALIGGIVALGLYALIAFHYAFSNDWMGPFRPGNAWGKDAVDISTWAISLPGHWLHVNKGILNNSPIYFFSCFGLLALAQLRDRRILLALSFYGATAATNGLHPDWEFGFCLPTRFLVTALPVLVLGLAFALPLLFRSATMVFCTALALTISLEGILSSLQFTESVFNDSNLLDRSINHFYPFHQHFVPPDQHHLPLLDLGFWALLVAALFLSSIHFSSQHRRLRLIAILITALAPFIWSRSETLADRLPLQGTSPYMVRLSSNTPSDRPSEINFEIPLKIPLETARKADGSLHAKPGTTPATLVNISQVGLPFLEVPNPGFYQLAFPGLRVTPPSGQISGHLTVTQRYTVRAHSHWESRTSYPLIGGKIDENYKITFQVDQPIILHIYCEYSGHGEIEMNSIQAVFDPTILKPAITEIHRVSHQPKQFAEGQALAVIAEFPNVPAGYYQVYFNLNGSTFSSFFERQPPPVKTAVFAADVSPDLLQRMTPLWFRTDPNWQTLPLPDWRRPLVESFDPPWWLSIPIAADQAYQLRFVLNQTQNIRCMLHYDGPENLELTDIVLYQVSFN